MRYWRELNMLLSRGLRCMFRIADGSIADARGTCPPLISDLVQRAGFAPPYGAACGEPLPPGVPLSPRAVDEFQDTSRAQCLEVVTGAPWGEAPRGDRTYSPTIFIVGDRKQSIYGFRDADVSILREAVRHIEAAADPDVRRSISRSFRAVPPLLAFVNDVCQDMDKAVGDGAFEHEEKRSSLIEPNASVPPNDPLGAILGIDSDEVPGIMAREIARLLHAGTEVRLRWPGLLRPVRPGDIAVLLRSRESEQNSKRHWRTATSPGHTCIRGSGSSTQTNKDALASSSIWPIRRPTCARRR